MWLWLSRPVLADAWALASGLRGWWWWESTGASARFGEWASLDATATPSPRGLGVSTCRCASSDLTATAGTRCWVCRPPGRVPAVGWESRGGDLDGDADGREGAWTHHVDTKQDYRLRRSGRSIVELTSDRGDRARLPEKGTRMAKREAHTIASSFFF